MKLVGNNSINLELSIISANPRSQRGTTNIFGKQFVYHDGPSFTATYKELFESNIYEFKPSNSKTIIDCGANMGLSVLYFSQNYPKHKIIAFEPDPEIFSILKENVETFDLKNVTIYQKAVWDKEEVLTFYADGKMGGRLDSSYKHAKPIEIETIPLADFINEDVDFLKIDIEGSEGVVLNGCKDVLHKIKHIFFEYHNSIKAPQTLHKLLELVSSEGFVYYIKESDVRKRPFIDEHNIAEAFNMALNVFCYKK
jgi:FkbM family methyltransferase